MGGSTAAVKRRAIALPAEHGSWGLVIEPIVLALMIEPSWGGVVLGIATFAAFLTRRPLKVALAERFDRKSSRGALAMNFGLAYTAIAAVAGGTAVALVGTALLTPLACAVPLAAVFLVYDVRNRSRDWQAEVAGAVAFAMAAAAITIAGGWSLAPSLGLSVTLASRALPSVLYVRSRIRLDRNKQHGALLTVGAHATAVVAVAVGEALGVLPTFAFVPFVVLLVRAAVGLSAYRSTVAIKTIGVTELGYGAMTVVMLAVAYWIDGT